MLAPPIASIEFNRTFRARKLDGLGGFALHSWRTCARGLLQNSEVARSEAFGAAFEAAPDLAAAAFDCGIRSCSRLGGGSFRRGKTLASHCVSPCAQTIGRGQLQNSCEVSLGTPEIVTAFLRESPLRQRGSKSGSSPIASLRSDAARLTSSFFKYQPARLKYAIASRW